MRVNIWRKRNQSRSWGLIGKDSPVFSRDTQCETRIIRSPIGETGLELVL